MWCLNLKVMESIIGVFPPPKAKTGLVLEKKEVVLFV